MACCQAQEIPVEITDRIRLKVGKYFYEQIDRNLYRIHKDNVILKECSNAVEAKQFLIESFSTDLDRLISDKLAAQGINKFTGEIGDNEA